MLVDAAWSEQLMAMLALVGLLISTYFTAIAYRWVEPGLERAWIPSFCRMGEATCATIVFTPRARVFGLPNSVLGQLFYSALLAGVAMDWLHTPHLLVYLAASALTVVLAIFLSYSLLFITRVKCSLCFASHAINVAIFLLLLGRF